MKIRELRSELVKRLAPLDNPALEARILLSHFLSLSVSELILKDSMEVEKDKEKEILDAASERLSGRPMAYITGKKEFYGHTFFVSEDVLIPQPDTETLVENALSLLNESRCPKVLDICTGSGAVITALKMERPDIEAFFSDISGKALSIAVRNYEHIVGEKAEAREGDLFKPWRGMRFNLITANPPYVTKEWYESVSMEVKREPYIALIDHGADGLDITRSIIEEAGMHLETDGSLVLEADYRQHAAIRSLLSGHGFSNIMTKKDLSGLERVTFATKKG